MAFTAEQRPSFPRLLYACDEESQCHVPWVPAPSFCAILHVKCKVLVTGQAHITNVFVKHLLYRPLENNEELQNLWSVSNLEHIYKLNYNLQITAV